VYHRRIIRFSDLNKHRYFETISSFYRKKILYQEYGQLSDLSREITNSITKYSIEVKPMYARQNKKVRKSRNEPKKNKNIKIINNIII